MADGLEGWELRLSAALKRTLSEELIKMAHMSKMICIDVYRKAPSGFSPLLVSVR